MIKIISSIIYLLQTIFKLSLPSSHNSIIYELDALKSLPFNEEYKYAADYNQYLSLIKNGHKFKNMFGLTLTNIENNGYISKMREKSYQEYIVINKKYNRFFGEIYWKARLLLLRFTKTNL